MMLTDIKNRFGTAVRSRRKRLGISQEELAGRSGLSERAIGNLERGTGRPYPRARRNGH